MSRPHRLVDLDQCHWFDNLGPVPCPLPHPRINHQASHQEGNDVPEIILIWNYGSLLMRSYFKALSDTDDRNKHVLYLTWVLVNQCEIV